MSALNLIAAQLAKPMTHVVVTSYAGGTFKFHQTRGANEAETWAHLERHKVGRDLISRNPDLTAGPVVQVVDVAIFDKAALGAQYVELIGYNPFEDDASITLSEVASTLAEYRRDYGSESVA